MRTPRVILVACHEVARADIVNGLAIMLPMNQHNVFIW